MAKPDHEKLYQTAEQQSGYFTAEQAQQAGLSDPLLSYHAKTGQFVRVRRGIYRLSRFPGSPHEDLFVAWLHAGPDAVISHESALAVYELSDVLPGEVHVIVRRTASRRRQGVRLHTNRLSSDEITRRAGLLVTSVARTIADVAATGLAEEQVYQAIQEALERGLVTREALLAHAMSRGGRASRLMRHAMGQDGSR